MNMFGKSGLLALFFLFWIPSVSTAQDAPPRAGFIDRNGDGRNDWFQDADGDGVNDMDGRPYPHEFEYRDEDRDGRNDLWADSDGDGVNDRLADIQRSGTHWVDRDGDGILDAVRPLRGRALKAHVLDADHDGRNDITLQPYSGSDLGGYRFGNIIEESGTEDPHYRDLDGDGMNDNDRFGQEQGRQMDRFLDSDGDGIADDRGFGPFGNPGKSRGKHP